MSETAGDAVRTPRLVATDLDGTLLDGAGTVSPRTRRVLEELNRRGVPVVFVTGRPIRWMESLWGAVGDHGLAVCSNGGVVYDVSGHRVARAVTIEPGECLDVAARIRRAMPGTTFALEKTGGFAREEVFLDGYEDPPGIQVGPLAELVDDSVVKMLALHPDIAPETYWKRVEEEVADLVTVTWSSTFAMVEMSRRGVTKASTLARLCAELDIDAADVVAFGDMPNDIEMLHWAGRSYAMADAHPAAQAVATDTAPAHDDDGVARVLEALFELDVDDYP